MAFSSIIEAYSLQYDAVLYALPEPMGTYIFADVPIDLKASHTPLSNVAVGGIVDVQ